MKVCAQTAICAQSWPKKVDNENRSFRRIRSFRTPNLKLGQ